MKKIKLLLFILIFAGCEKENSQPQLRQDAIPEAIYGQYAVNRQCGNSLYEQTLNIEALTETSVKMNFSNNEHFEAQIDGTVITINAQAFYVNQDTITISGTGQYSSSQITLNTVRTDTQFGGGSQSCVITAVHQ